MTVKLRRPYAKYPDLTAGQVYPVLGIEADHLRILNDFRRPYLHPPRLFTTVNDGVPDDWIVEVGDNGERYAEPAAINAPGFLKDLFDGKPRANAIFRKSVNRQLSQAI